MLEKTVIVFDQDGIPSDTGKRIAVVFNFALETCFPVNSNDGIVVTS